MEFYETNPQREGRDFMLKESFPEHAIFIYTLKYVSLKSNISECNIVNKRQQIVLLMISKVAPEKDFRGCASPRSNGRPLEAGLGC